MTGRSPTVAARSTSTTRARRPAGPSSSRTESSRGYMQDRLNARLMGMKATGNGRRESYAHPPMPRMTNTFMLAGEDDPEEILKSVKHGLYAVTFGGGQVDITNGKFVFSASEAYLVEDGRVTAPVKGATLIGNGPGGAHAHLARGPRPAARRGRRHLRQGRPVRAGRRRPSDHPHRRHHRGRNSSMKPAPPGQRACRSHAATLAAGR